MSIDLDICFEKLEIDFVYVYVMIEDFNIVVIE